MRRRCAPPRAGAALHQCLTPPPPPPCAGAAPHQCLTPPPPAQALRSIDDVHTSWRHRLDDKRLAQVWTATQVWTVTQVWNASAFDELNRNRLGDRSCFYEVNRVALDAWSEFDTPPPCLSQVQAAAAARLSHEALLGRLLVALLVALMAVVVYQVWAL